MQTRRRRSSGATLIIATLAFCGCVVEPGPGGEPAPTAAVDDSRDAALVKALSILQREGFDTADAEITEDGSLRIEGDMTFQADQVLAHAESLVQKGYRHAGLSDMEGDDICLQFVPPESGAPSLPLTWVIAFFEASVEYTTRTNVRMRISPFWDQTCKQVIFIEYKTLAGKPGYIAETPLEFGSPRPAPFLYVNRGFWGSMCNPDGSLDPHTGGTLDDLPYSSVLLTVIHELGHALGLRHADTIARSESPRAEHIPDTGVNEPFNVELFPSVMYQGQYCVGAMDGVVTGRLSDDDVKSINWLYR